jgi:hypothetical protein
MEAFSCPCLAGRLAPPPPLFDVCRLDVFAPATCFCPPSFGCASPFDVLIPWMFSIASPRCLFFYIALYSPTVFSLMHCLAQLVWLVFVTSFENACVAIMVYYVSFAVLLHCSTSVHPVDVFGICLHQVLDACVISRLHLCLHARMLIVASMICSCVPLFHPPICPQNRRHAGSIRSRI